MRKKIGFLVFLSSFFASQISWAASNEQKEIMSSLLDDSPKETVKKEEQKIQNSKTIEEAQDSRGLFSFMNFSFGKDEKKNEIVDANQNLSSLFDKAQSGDTDAQITLGYLYLYGGEGIEADYKKSFEFYSMAAERGDKVAINNLGILYYSGIGTKKDIQMAAKNFAKAVELGNSEAATNLAFIFLTGNGGVVKDNFKAVKFFEIAAEGGNPTAKFMLGYAYHRGFVVKKDPIKAFSLMKEAAAAKYDEAQYFVARMYLRGEGTTKNYGQAVRNFGLAADQGNVNAMTEMADILADGIYYNKNIYKAHILYNVAAVRGAEKAAEKRDILEKALKIEELLVAQSEAEAFKEKPSELTTYIHGTFGKNIRGYIDEAFQATTGKIY